MGKIKKDGRFFSQTGLFLVGLETGIFSRLRINDVSFGKAPFYPNEPAEYSLEGNRFDRMDPGSIGCFDPKDRDNGLSKYND